MKVKHYNEMMAYLTRPGFNSGGSVNFNGGGSVKKKPVLPKRKPPEEVKKRQKINYEKIKQYLGEESRELIERELGFKNGGKVKKYGGSLTDAYTILIDQWNRDLLKAYEAKDLSTLKNSFTDYAGKELNISNKKVNSQISGLYRRNKLDEKFLDVIQFRKELAKELITEANQGLKYTNLKDVASKLGPNYQNATLKTLIGRVPEIPELDTYETKVNKAFQKIFVDADPEKVLAKNFFDPAQKIQDVIGTGIKGAEGRKKDTIYKALKNNPDYKDLGFEKIFNRLRSKDFQKVVLKSDAPWNLSDVSYAVDNNLNLKNPKSIDERAVNFAIRSKIQGNPNIEIFSREGDRLVKLDNPKAAQIDNYYDIVFKMNRKSYGLMGDIPGVINLQKEGRQLPEFKNFYAKAAAKDELAQRTKFPDGTDIINPRTGKPSTFEDLMKDTYYFARGKKKGYAMAFPYDLEHLDIKNDPFGNIKPENLRILPKRINLSVGDKTGKAEDVIKKTGYFFEKDLPLDQQLNNLMNREKNLAQKVLKFDREGNYIGRRLDTAVKAAKKQIQTRGLSLVKAVNDLPSGVQGKICNSLKAGGLSTTCAEAIRQDPIKTASIVEQETTKLPTNVGGKALQAARFVKNVAGPAAIAGEVAFAAPFALYDYATGADRDEIISNLTFGLGGKSQEEQLTELYGENFGLAQKAIETGERLDSLEKLQQGTRGQRIRSKGKFDIAATKFEEQISPFIKNGQFDEAAFQENRRLEQEGRAKFLEQKSQRAKQRKDTLTGLEFDLGFAGGGIAKEGGVDSGVAPESGPTPDGPSEGLASLLKNGMKIKE
jgi:hypothetical protein